MTASPVLGLLAFQKRDTEMVRIGGLFVRPVEVAEAESNVDALLLTVVIQLGRESRKFVRRDSLDSSPKHDDGVSGPLLALGQRLVIVGIWSFVRVGCHSSP